MRLARSLAFAATLTLAATAATLAQDRDSPGGEPHGVHALVGGRVVTRPGEVLEEATVVIRDGVVEAVGPAVVVPGDARVWDVRGLTIYPGLIEPYLRLESPPKGDEDDAHAPKPEPAPDEGARHENPRVRAERSMASELDLDGDTLEGLREAGFTAALLVPGRGIFRGSSALVALRDGGPREQLIRSGVAQHVAFERGWPRYPSSLMGAMALIRQTLLDAEHHAAAWDAYRANSMGQARPEANLTLEALGRALAGRQPFCVEAHDAQMLLRGASLFTEHGLVPWMVTGSNDSYRWLEEVQATGASLVVSLNFPPAPTWDGEAEEVTVESEALRHWHLAPENPARLAAARVRFAFTTQGLKDRSLVLDRVRRAIARGLSPDAALAALTTAPAALLRAPQLGVVAPGAAGNLTIADGDLFAKDTRVVEVWVDGARYDTTPDLPRPQDVAGTWELDLDGAVLKVTVKAEDGALSATGTARGAPEAVALPAPRLWRDELTLSLPSAVSGIVADATLTCRVDGRLVRGTFRAGQHVGRVFGRLAAPSQGDGEEDQEQEGEAADAPADDQSEETADDAPAPLAVSTRAPWPPLPEGAAPAVLVRGATLWTLAGDEPVLEGADLLCEGGKITAVGRDLEAPAGAVVIDAAGRHVTPGIIDCHSHAFITGGVNEATHTCTAEVRIADVLDAERIHIYRQLAGGVTASNVLHGSANAIGGQNAVIKLRWGRPASGLLVEGAPGGIKWALGENPKRSNWGEGLPPRYPTSRSGVLEAIRERLAAARDYARELAAWRRRPDPGKVPPRIDLQLEALVEVLEGERLVHCHSYRQDEILGLIRLAEAFGFRIGTFQHVLEGYKVADEIAAHGAGASTFSDWWAYKFEVYDAVAYNGTLMWRRGVNVSFNSDSAEMARRLNQEAAKAVRYGGMPAPEALKLVTLNPAQQLGLGERLGSLEPGKDADFVIWSAPPLSTRAICDETWIEGRRYYARDRDAAAAEPARAEREALLAAARRARYAEPTGVWEWEPTFGAGAAWTSSDDHSCCEGGAH